MAACGSSPIDRGARLGRFGDAALGEDRIAGDALRNYVQEILRGHGVDDEQAQIVSGNLVWSELVGRSTQGVVRMPVYAERLRRGVLKCPCSPTFEVCAPCMQLLDGDEGFGQYVGELGMRRAIEIARENGVGAVGVHNSNFFGTGAYFANMAARADMLALVVTNSFPKVAAHGGLKSVLGTNPFAFGAPRRNGQGILVDMATSALAGSTVREHAAKSRPLPAGLAINASNAPVTDARDVEAGALLPFGGAKGYGLALMVEVLGGVITGAGVSHGVASMYNNFKESGNNGHFLMALDISRWMPLEAYFDRLESLVATIKASGLGREVLLPGEARWKAYACNCVNGIAVAPETRVKLGQLAAPLGIRAPWE